MDITRGGGNISKKCPIPKILIAIDDSDNFRRVVKHIACLASQFEDKDISRITLLHVLHIPDRARWVLEEEMHEDIVNKLEKIQKNRFNKIFEEAEDILEKHGIKKSKISRKTKTGDPAKEIIKEAKRGKYTTIVMGKRGRSRIAEIFVGSVTKTVIDRAGNFDMYIVK